MWLDDAEDPAGAELIGRLTETGEPCIKATTVLPFAAGVQRLIDVEFEDGHRYGELARLKAEYDPRNLFRMNANIPPATY